MFLNALNISGSALTAEQYRLNLIAENIANVDTTRTENGGPYKRKVPIFQESTDYNGYNTNSAFTDYLSYFTYLGKTLGNVNNSSVNNPGNVANANVAYVNNIVAYNDKAVFVKPNLGGYALNGVSSQTSGNFVKNKYNLSNNNINANGGVKITKVIEDPTPGKMVYDPEHPDANADGYVEMPNVDMTQEMVDMMGASRAYEANVQAVNAIKAMATKALEIGR